EARRNADVLQQLAAIDRTRLAPADRLNYDLFKRQYEVALDEYKFKSYLLPINQREGIQSSDDLANQLRFTTVKDYEDWLARLHNFGTLMDQTITLMREGLRAGIKHPRVIMERLPAQLDRQIVAPEKSGFYAPFTKFPATIPAADQQRLAAAGRTEVEKTVLPAFQRLKTFFVNEYITGSYPEVGAWQYPNGDAYYAFTARKFTTTNTTPEEIHQTGLAEVKRIRAEMEGIKTRTGFKGAMPEFFKFLRTDPRFFYKTGDEVLTASRAIAKRIDPKLVLLFKRLPRMPYGVEPIPMTIAPDTTAAYYQQPAADGSRAGTYSVNLYQPESRPKWEMMALTLHESVPGHHLQIALGMELGEIPNFRRYGYYNAFGEGWGLYAESLGDEMGLYDDPYSKFGQLTYEMWRAVRLVVDTGIHYKHWTRQQAIDFFMENAPKAELDIVNEIDRYIAWPGQALAYKVGELKIKELRAKSAKEFGDRFNVKDFHDIVLGSGALPLDVLEQNVNEWINTNCHKECELPFEPPPATKPPATKPGVIKKPAPKSKLTKSEVPLPKQ
ncbi:MAG TPA: DUF885 domain-containing protein, partial [Terriglobales bacterium]|nr:DUF885 domain-containing protein [Terriglobales bacterium]